MPTHLSDQQQQAYLTKTMTPADLLAADEHLAACELCRLQLSEAGRLAAAFPLLTQEFSGLDATPGEHLTYAQLANYVDRKSASAERGMVEAHAVACGSCLERLESLVSLSEGNTTAPVAGSAPAVPTFMDRLRSLLVRSPGDAPMAAPAWRRGLVPACAAMAAGLLVFVILQGQVSNIRQDLRIAKSDSERLLVQREESDSLAARLMMEKDELERGKQQMAAAVSQLSKRSAELKRTIGLARAAAARETSASSAPRIALRTQPLPEVAALLKQDTMMGGPDEGKAFTLRFPVAEVTESDRPVLRWQSVPGATGYRLSVSEGKDVSNEVFSESVTGTEWKPTTALKRGTSYSWQVTPMQGDAEMVGVVSAPLRARFRVLPQTELNVMKKADSDSRDALRDRAVRYANAGVFLRAEAILMTMLQEDPTDLASRNLLKNIRSLRRPRP